MPISFVLAVHIISSTAILSSSGDVFVQTSAIDRYNAISTGPPNITNTPCVQMNSTSNDTAMSRWLPCGGIVRGVNLGSQFIIEPWMAWDEFNSMGCGELEDEWSCVQKLGQESADAAFARHWDTWISQADIMKIANLGLNVIRIPVGFWIKEDLVGAWEYYPRGGLSYLDRLVDWAADAGLKVIIDLHGGPGSQSQNQSFTGHVSTEGLLTVHADPEYREPLTQNSTTGTTTKELCNFSNGWRLAFILLQSIVQQVFFRS